MFLSNFSLFPSPLTKQAPPQEGPFALKSLIILPIPYEYKILQNIKEQNYLVFFFFFFHQFFFHFLHFKVTIWTQQCHDHMHEIILMRLSSNTSNAFNKFLLSSKPFIKPSFLHQVVKPNVKLCSFWFFCFCLALCSSLAIFVFIAFCDAPSCPRRCNLKPLFCFQITYQFC